MTQHTDKFLQTRRFYMALPVLVLPFLTIIFWALGGGHGVPAQTKAADFAGLNLTLPDAHFEEGETWDKLSLYEIAQRDSAKYEEARESDPYFDLIAFRSNQELEVDTTRKEGQLIDSFKQKDRLTADPNEERVNKKLQELYSELNKSAVTTTRSAVTSSKQNALSPPDPEFTNDVDRLEQIMERMQGDGEPDPEMQRIESVLEKILDIQHPERVKEKIKSIDSQNKSETLPVDAVNHDENISLFHAQDSDLIQSFDSTSVKGMFPALPNTPNGFYGLTDEMPLEQLAGNAIDAVIHDTQELVAGATVKLRLSNDIEIAGKRIHKDQFIYGICAINGERLTVEISSIRTGNALLPVSLEVYDLDGLPGIYIPGAITRDAAKQASDNALQNVQLMSLNPSIGAQAAAAGVEAVKGLFSKKAKLVKVTVKAGYQVFLKDTNPVSAF